MPDASADVSADLGVDDSPRVEDAQPLDVVTPRDVPVTPDVLLERDVPITRDVPVERDVPVMTDVATRCGPNESRQSLTRSTRCAVRSARSELSMLCGALTPCPVTDAVAMDCPGGAYGPWLVTAPEGATVLVTNNTSGFHSQLLTIPRGGAPRVEEVPFMTSAANALALDRAGVRYLVAGEMPGAVLHRETPTGWTTQPIATAGSTLLLVSAAAIINERVGFALFQNLSRNGVDLATTRDGCWTHEERAPMALWRAQLSLDAMDRPWITSYRSSGGAWELYLRGADRERMLDRYTGSIAGNAEAHLVSAEAASADQRPTVLARHADGEHYLHTPAAAEAYAARALPSLGPVVGTGDCPSGGPPRGGCMGQAMCTRREAQPMAQHAAARTADGSIWVARLYEDWTTSYRLREMCGGPGCVCTTEAVAWRGSTELRLQRVRGAEVRDALRLTLSNTRPIGLDRLAMTARGATLSLVAPAASMEPTSLRYLEIDTAMIR